VGAGSNGIIFDDLETLTRVSRSRYKSNNFKTHKWTKENTNRKPYTIYRTTPLSMTFETASWMSDYLAVKPSAIGQPTWPTQPSIPQGSVNE